MQNTKRTKVIKKGGHVITINNFSDKSDIFCKLLVAFTLGGIYENEKTNGDSLYDEREKVS